MTFDNYKSFIIVFLLTGILTFFLVITKSLQLKISKERIAGPQKIHNVYIPRIGGISIYLILFLYSLTYLESMLLYYIISSSSLIFFAGFFEDITNKISPKTRLIFTVISSIFCLFLINHGIHSVGFEKIDDLISGTYLPYFFSFLSIILLTQAFNIIDGLNGLCILNAALILLSISYVSYINENLYLLNISFLILCSFLGLIFFNFPKPLIFIGDGGAYFTGFLLATLLIILPEKIKVSPFFSLALVIYPVYETLRSFFRRLIIKKRSFMQPDMLHFHSLVFKYLNNKKIIKQDWLVNSFSSVISLLLPSMIILWACFNYDNRNNLIFGIFLFLFIYEILIYYLKKIV